MNVSFCGTKCISEFLNPTNEIGDSLLLSHLGGTAF